MSYRVELTAQFQREAKQLRKKYHSLKLDLSLLIDDLATNPTRGIALRNGVYKIRLIITAKGKGGSGGARVMTFVKIEDNKVILFFIYNKGNRDTLSKKEIKGFIKDLY